MIRVDMELLQMGVVICKQSLNWMMSRERKRIRHIPRLILIQGRFIRGEQVEQEHQSKTLLIGIEIII